MKARYHSFQRYFRWLIQLGWVEYTGEEQTSAMQEATEYHPDAHPRKLYRLTRKGIEATDEDWAHPQRLVYPEVMGVPKRTTSGRKEESGSTAGAEKRRDF